MATNYTPLTFTTQTTGALAISDLVAKLTTAITANPAWTVEASVGPIGTNSWNYVVFKNSAAQSGLAADYRFTIAYNANTLYSLVSEGYASAGVPQCQNVSLSSGTATGGSYTITVNGQTTTPIGYNLPATTIQTSLQALSGVGAAGVIVTGGNIASASGFDLAFQHTASVIANPVVSVNSSLTGTSPVVTVSNKNYMWTSCFNNVNSPGWVDSQGRFPDAYNTAESVGASSTGVWNSRGVSSQNFLTPPLVGATYAPLASMAATAAVSLTYYYAVIAYKDHLVIGWATTAPNMVFYYIGATIPVYPASDPFAVGSFNLNWNGGVSTVYPMGGFTRAGASFYNTSTNYWVASGRATGAPPLQGTDFEYQPASYLYASRDTQVSLVSGKYYFSRVYIPQALTTNTTYTVGEVRALYRDLVGSNSRPASVAIGDTITLNGTQWMCIYTSATTNNYYVDTGAP